MTIKNNTTRLLLLALLISLNTACDQISKIVVRKNIADHEQISLIKNHLTLTKVENTGAFLSLGDELPDFVRFSLLSLMPIAVLCFGFYYLFSQPKLPLLLQIAISFLLGGGIGNIYDRLKFGSVTDFLHIDFGLFSTGIFNFADVSIMIGSAALLIQMVMKKSGKLA